MTAADADRQATSPAPGAQEPPPAAGSPGPLLLAGGGIEHGEGAVAGALGELAARTGAARVVVLPTAAAYEGPERAVLEASRWVESLGLEVEGLMVSSRGDAEDPGAAAVVRQAGFVYLADGSALHLRAVLKDSAVFDALRAAWRGGALVAGAGAGAVVLTDPMVDPRGGALTMGLGLLDGLAVIAHFGDAEADAHGEKLHRSVVLAPDGVPVAAIPTRGALVRDPTGGWRSIGHEEPVVYLNGRPAALGLGALPGGSRLLTA